MSRSWYPDAGKNAPRGVKRSVSEYFQLSEEEQRAQPLLYFLLGSGTPDYKAPLDVGEYVDKTDLATKCSNCRHFYIQYATGAGVCAWLRDDVVAEGWCIYWYPV